MKRLIGFVLAVLCIPLHSFPVFAADYEESVTYEIVQDHVAITGLVENAPIRIVIPEEIEGFPVTEIADGAFRDCTSIKVLSIPDTVTVIGDEACSGCSFNTLHISECVERLGARAFAGCGYLGTEIIPTTVTEIGEGCFSGVWVSDLYLADGMTHVDDAAFRDMRITRLCFTTSIQEIGTDAFAGVTGIETVYYSGSEEDWTKIRFGTGNQSLRTASVICDRNTPSVTREFKFIPGQDNWSFKNSDIEAYSLTEEDQALVKRQGAEQTYDRFLAEEYGGCCYGFSLTALLVCAGILEPGDIFPGAKTLHEIPMTPEVISCLTYYQFVQSQSAYLGNSYLKGTYSHAEHLKKLTDAAGRGEPMLICFNALTEQGIIRHAVLGYGLEYGEWTYDGITYDSRILLYDCNKAEYDENFNLYFCSDDLYEATIPGYSEHGVAFVGMSLTDVTNDLNILNIGGKYGAGRETYMPLDIGDPDGDGMVNAADASTILAATAAIGLDHQPDLTNMQETACDVDQDGKIDAVDASLVLCYAAETGLGTFSGVLKDFLDLQMEKETNSF